MRRGVNYHTIKARNNRIVSHIYNLRKKIN